MGRRGDKETISLVLLAFLEQRTWQQSELAKHVGVSRRALVRALKYLKLKNDDLEREPDHPHVYWSVPSSWFAGAIAFKDRDLADLARLLHRTPRGAMRERLLRLSSASTPPLQNTSSVEAILTQPLSAEAETQLSRLEDSIVGSFVVRVQFTGSSGDPASLSVHSILLDRQRLIATCHRENRLKWYRLNGILSVGVDSRERYRPATEAQLGQFLRHSVDDHHSGEPPTRSVFRARRSVAEWLQDRLPFAEASVNGDAVVLTAHTSGLTALAQLLVSLGNAVTIETPELRLLVAQLARAALDANG